MSFGERLKFFRKKKGLTQRQLGMACGFSERTADVRIAQYENESRHPKEDILKKISATLNINSETLCVPTFETADSVLHALFFLEDYYGLMIKLANNEPELFIESVADEKSASIYVAMLTWASKAEELKSGVISKEEYDLWRYNYAEQK